MKKTEFLFFFFSNSLFSGIAVQHPSFFVDVFALDNRYSLLERKHVQFVVEMLEPTDTAEDPVQKQLEELHLKDTAEEEKNNEEARYWELNIDSHVQIYTSRLIHM